MFAGLIRGTVLFSFVLILILACGKKEPTAPIVPDPQYTIYMSSLIDHSVLPYYEHYLVSYDPVNKEIIDSFNVIYPVHDIAMSEDGSIIYFIRYFDAYYDPGVFALDWKTGDTLAQQNGLGGTKLAISEDYNHAFISSGTVALLSLPDLTPLFTEQKISASGVFLPGRDIVCYNTGSEFTFLDYSGLPIVRSQKSLISQSGDTLRDGIIIPSSSGDSLIIYAYDATYEHKYFIIASSDSLRIINQFDASSELILSAHGVLHPDGTKAYFRYFGYYMFPGPPLSPGIVYEVDLKTGTIQEIFNGDAFGDRIYVSDISISPDQTKLYISGSRSLVSYDLSSGEYAQMFFAENFSGFAICVGIRIE